MRSRAVPDRAPFYVSHGKRLIDLCVGVLALVALFPLLVLLAVLVRRRMGAPVLFRQTRTGYRGEAFTIFKFRTMTDACDAAGNLLPDGQRLTPFGNFLRVSSLDELPELVNVVRGEMSLVGPRPLGPEYDAYYTERERTRFAVLPGITGWAQINGRNDLPWDDRLECDAWYVEHRSWWLDLKILGVTLWKVLRRDNVEPDPTQTMLDLDEERRRRGRVRSL
jgi:lipopolysaccharide/colanic/teichoic acid biosynthesis glycosyltransferase